jgi:hypothetical protein
VTPEAVALSENLREAMRFFGGARGNGEVRRLGSLTLISSGIDYSVFNAAVLGAPVRGRIDGLGIEMREAEEFYRRRGLPWSFWACEDLIEEGLRMRVRDALEAMDMRHLTSAPGMYAERLLPASRPLPEVTVRPVVDAETRAAFAHITSMAFEIPLSVCRAVYAEDRAWGGDVCGVAGVSRVDAGVDDRAGGLWGRNWGVLGGHAAGVPAARICGSVDAAGDCRGQGGDGD